jgi:hypothetical protein
MKLARTTEIASPAWPYLSNDFKGAKQPSSNSLPEPEANRRRPAAGLRELRVEGRARHASLEGRAPLPSVKYWKTCDAQLYRNKTNGLRSLYCLMNDTDTLTARIVAEMGSTLVVAASRTKPHLERGWLNV